MSFKDGDFVEIDYSAWREADNTLLYTTYKEQAEKAGIYDKGREYGAALVVIGSNGVVRGLERELKGMNQGETKRFTLEPGDAFGERREELVKVMPFSEFRAHNIDPAPGMSIDIDGIPSIVRSVNSGRVVIDQNHPEAGRKIIYEVKVLRLLNESKDKIMSLGKTYGVAPSEVKLNGGEAEILFSDSVKKNADYFIGKANLVAAVFNYLKDIKKVNVKEEFERPKEQTADKEAENKE
jgi:FKBP-type peptidyl-prolyl cis-trans isomerase 2